MSCRFAVRPSPRPDPPGQPWPLRGWLRSAGRRGPGCGPSYARPGPSQSVTTSGDRRFWIPPERTTSSYLTSAWSVKLPWANSPSIVGASIQAAEPTWARSWMVSSGILNWVCGSTLLIRPGAEIMNSIMPRLKSEGMSVSVDRPSSKRRGPRPPGAFGPWVTSYWYRPRSGNVGSGPRDIAIPPIAGVTSKARFGAQAPRDHPVPWNREHLGAVGAQHLHGAGHRLSGGDAYAERRLRL